MALYRRRSAILLPVALLGLAVLGIEPVSLRDLAVEGSGYRLAIGSIKAPLWSAAWAQGATKVTLENVDFTFGQSNYRAKRIDFSGVTSTRVELEALFDPAAPLPFPDRLAKITAEEVSIPELAVEQRMGENRHRATYRNIVGNGLRDGMIKTMTIETSSEEMIGSKRKSVVTRGRSSAEETDFAALARILTEKGGPEPGSLAKVQGTFVSEDIAVSDASGTVIEIARLSGRDLYMRPTQESWAGTGALFAGMADADKLSASDKDRLVALMTDIWGAFDIGLIELADIKFTGPSAKGDVAARIGRLAYSGPVTGRPSEAHMDGFEVVTKEGSAKIASLAFTGFSFQPTFDGLKSLQAKSLEQVDPASLRKLAPTLGTVSMTGIDFDLPKEEPKRNPSEKVQFTVRHLEITADTPINGIPSNLRFAMQNLSMALPPNSGDDGVRTLLGLGYKALDLSLTTAANWNEATNEFILREASANGRDMGNLTLRGTFGGVTKDAFDPDSAVAVVALMKATAKGIDLSVENTGLVDRHLEQEARKQGKTAETLRREYGMAAGFAIPALLGNSPQATALGQAIARFIAKPTRLTIAARAKNPAGLGLPELIGSDPAAILDKFDVSTGTDQPL